MLSRELTKLCFVCKIVNNDSKEKGQNMLKKTKTRELVKSILDSSSKPLSAYDIFEQLKDKEITLSSIYRTLDTFNTNGIVTKDTSNNKISKYSIIKKEHQHFLECRECHSSTPLDFCPYHTANKKIKNETKFTVDEHNLIIFGICDTCNKGNKKK